MYFCCYEYQNKNNCEIDFKKKLKEEFLYKNYRYSQILIYLSIPSETRAKNFTYIRYTFRNVQIFENVFFRVSFVVFKLKLYVTFRRDRLLYLDIFWVFLVCSILSALEQKRKILTFQNPNWNLFTICTNICIFTSTTLETLNKPLPYRSLFRASSNCYTVHVFENSKSRNSHL